MDKGPDAEIDKIGSVLLKTEIPDSKQNLIEGGAVESVGEENGLYIITINLKVDRVAQIALDVAIKTNLSREGISPKTVKVKFLYPPVEKEEKEVEISLNSSNKIASFKHIIAVGSGKGGVGKSTTSINIAASLAARGYKVGILDSDIYGPSIGKMSGFSGKADVEVRGEKIIPVEKYGMKIMSFSFLIDQTKAVVWRGPMLGKALEQLLFDIEWGELDYLIIDLPPGTGDVQLSLAQLTTIDGVIIVTTPQNVALQDARRAVDMFRQVNIPILGVIENMSEYICPNCGHSAHIFSKDGGKNMAAELNVKLLGNIPLTSELMESGENGVPISSLKDTEHKNENSKRVMEAYNAVIDNLISVI